MILLVVGRLQQLDGVLVEQLVLTHERVRDDRRGEDAANIPVERGFRTLHRVESPATGDNELIFVAAVEEAQSHRQEENQSCQWSVLFRATNLLKGLTDELLCAEAIVRPFAVTKQAGGKVPLFS